MNPEIEKLLIEQYKMNISEANKCNVAYRALTGRDIEDSTHLRHLTLRTETGNFALKGGNVSLHVNGKKYDPKSPATKKILYIIATGDKLYRKKNLVEEYAKKENDNVTEELTTQVTNALANLKRDNQVANYKPENVKQKGGYWGLSEWFEGDKPKPQYLMTIADDDLVF